MEQHILSRYETKPFVGAFDTSVRRFKPINNERKEQGRPTDVYTAAYRHTSAQPDDTKSWRLRMYQRIIQEKHDLQEEVVATKSQYHRITSECYSVLAEEKAKLREELFSFQSKMEEKGKSQKKEYETHIQSMEDKTALIQANHEDIVTTMKKAYDDQIQHFRGTIEDMRKSHAEQLESQETIMEKERGLMLKEHQDKTKLIQRNHEYNVETIETSFQGQIQLLQKTIDDMQKFQTEQQRTQKYEMNREREMLMKEHEADKKILEQKREEAERRCDTQLDIFKEASEKTETLLDNQVKALRHEIKMMKKHVEEKEYSISHERETLKNKHQVDIENLNMAFDKTLQSFKEKEESMKLKHFTELQLQNECMTEERQKCNNRHNSEIEGLRREMEAQRNRLKAAFKEKLKFRTAKLKEDAERDQVQNASPQVSSEIKQERERLERWHSLELQSLKRAMAEERAWTEKEFGDQLQAAKDNEKKAKEMYEKQYKEWVLYHTVHKAATEEKFERSEGRLERQLEKSDTRQFLMVQRQQQTMDNVLFPFRQRGTYQYQPPGDQFKLIQGGV